MKPETLTYTFHPKVPFRQVVHTLLLSAIAVEGLHGQTRTRLEDRTHLDRAARTCVIRTESAVGRDLALIFTQFLTSEFGERAFQVKRVSPARRVGAAV